MDYHQPRNLDHLILSTENLDQTREFFRQLGFHVAADGIHPFGTKNACIFFEDGSYFEPLAIHDQAVFDRELAAGNQFLIKLQAFRNAVGMQGLSGIAISSKDVDADQALFEEKGISLGKPFTFSRALEMPDGSQSTISFHLNFTANTADDPFLGFTIVRGVPLPSGKSALISHENGVISVSKVGLSSFSSSDYHQYLSILTGNDMALEDGKAHYDLGATKLVLSEQNVGNRSLHGAWIELRVENLDKTRDYFTDRNLDFTEKETAILIRAEAQLGCDLIFTA